jgi:hypothetical protein
MAKYKALSYIRGMVHVCLGADIEKLSLSQLAHFDGFSHQFAGGRCNLWLFLRLNARCIAVHPLLLAALSTKWSNSTGIGISRANLKFCAKKTSSHNADQRFGDRSRISCNRTSELQVSIGADAV